VNILTDLRYAIRMLLKQPAFTLTCIGILALGIGANTAVFSVVNSTLLRPLSFPESGRLVAVWETNVKFNSDSVGFSYPEFSELRRDNKVFEKMAFYFRDEFTLSERGETALHVQGTIASADLFDVLRVRPAIGRKFRSDEDKVDGPPVAIVSHQLWMNRFGGDPNILGRTITLDGKSYEIVGVMPRDFQFPVGGEPSQLWIPLSSVAGRQPDGSPSILEQRANHSYNVVARLVPGVTLERANANGNAIISVIGQEFPADKIADAVRVAPMLSDITGDIRPVLWILLGAAASVLLIGCLNVANLLLARSMGRQREMGIRAALGARRSRIVQQLLIEAALLALCGGLSGLVLAIWLTNGFQALLPADFPRKGDITLDGSILLFTMGVSIITGLIFGLAPAWKVSRANTSSVLGGSATRAFTESRRSRGLRNTLIILEISFSLALLAAAGLLIQSFWRLQGVNPGFDPHHVVIAQMQLPDVTYPTNQDRTRFFNRFFEAVRNLPGTSEISGAGILPVSGQWSNIVFQFEGKITSVAESPVSNFNRVFPGYFAVMHIPIRMGRDFTIEDDETHPRVVVINKTFSDTFFPGQNPIGKRIGLAIDASDSTGKFPLFEVVGVIDFFSGKSLGTRMQAEFYVPCAQYHAGSINIVVRTGLSEDAVAANLREASGQVDKDIPIYSVRTMDHMLANSIAQPRVNTALLTGFALVAIILTTTGLYGVMSYSVAQRTPEIGIRLALGASTPRVLQLVIGQGMKLVGIGVGIGIAASLIFNQLLSSLLYGVSATDGLTLVSVTTLLVVVALIALWLPARRASRIDPLTALRNE
jgi:putative ABC transport system permease protein